MTKMTQWLVAVLVLALGGEVGCSGHHARGNPAAGADAGVAGDDADVLTDCERACEVAVHCVGDGVDVDECRASCVEEASSFGELGAAAVALCADCLSASGCLELASGACDEACPAAGGFVVDGPGDPGDPGDSGDATCTASWPDAGHDLTVQCLHDDYDDTYDCECADDGVLGRAFVSIDFCDVEGLQQVDEANRGCAWRIGVRDDCSQEWESNGAAMAVTCTGTALGWDCTCWGGNSESFFSDEFCDLELGGRTDRANAACRFALAGG